MHMQSACLFGFHHFLLVPCNQTCLFDVDSAFAPFPSSAPGLASVLRFLAAGDDVCAAPLFFVPVLPLLADAFLVLFLFSALGLLAVALAAVFDLSAADFMPDALAFLVCAAFWPAALRAEAGRAAAQTAQSFQWTFHCDIIDVDSIHSLFRESHARQAEKAQLGIHSNDKQNIHC